MQKNLLKRFIFTVLILWFFIPTIVPPLALLSKTRFGVELIPKLQESNDAIKWVNKNLAYNEKLIVLDARSPHPSGMGRVMVEAGVFAPIFSGDFRAYTIEASPEYLDIAYYLSPSAIRKLKVGILLIDDVFFETLPSRRKEQLADNKYFDKIFDNSSKTKDWEEVYRIKDAYLINGGEIEGTFGNLTKNFYGREKIYIDNEEGFDPSYLRRALIFSLRDRDLYFLPQSGVYLNVETNINQKTPLDDGKYNYLILGKNTDPKSICGCPVELIWGGIHDAVRIWKNSDMPFKTSMI